MCFNTVTTAIGLRSILPFTVSLKVKIIILTNANVNVVESALIVWYLVRSTRLLQTAVASVNNVIVVVLSVAGMAG